MKEAKDRAEKASKLLAGYAEKHTSVVLVGHVFYYANHKRTSESGCYNRAQILFQKCARLRTS
ncbi:hypothetical protein BI350_11660 [Sporosarcina ureilytica]|uniref:Uncharacterized protein n=1 Tax=Sporosarcina ureilytica TaxID=298596 RepID=A0A1D8JHD7_9BACL|nr:hypothetical protein BI350_11660 [Sporosarcina ureilytica]